MKHTLKYLIAILIALNLTGCYQSVNNVDLERAVKVCGGIDQIVVINSVFTGMEQVSCKDGKEHVLDRVVLK